VPGRYPPVAGPFWAIANVTPPSNKTVVRPITTDLVIVFSGSNPSRLLDNLKSEY
jgi:hypothetical protein